MNSRSTDADGFVVAHDTRAADVDVAAFVSVQIVACLIAQGDVVRAASTGSTQLIQRRSANGRVVVAADIKVNAIAAIGYVGVTDRVE